VRVTRSYSRVAAHRAADDALDWLQENKDGYPRSWQQEDADDVRRGYCLYDDFEAPPIAGYEMLESEGKVVRLETVSRDDGLERVHFWLRVPTEVA